MRKKISKQSKAQTEEISDFKLSRFWFFLAIAKRIINVAQARRLLDENRIVITSRPWVDTTVTTQSIYLLRKLDILLGNSICC